jgi:hypothetical protein
MCWKAVAVCNRGGAGTYERGLVHGYDRHAFERLSPGRSGKPILCGCRHLLLFARTCVDVVRSVVVGGASSGFIVLELRASIAMCDNVWSI